MKCPICMKVFKKATEAFIVDHMMRCSAKQEEGNDDDDGGGGSSSTRSSKIRKKSRSSTRSTRRSNKGISSPSNYSPAPQSQSPPDVYVRRSASSRTVQQTSCPICTKVFNLSEISLAEVNRHINICSDALDEVSAFESSPNKILKEDEEDMHTKPSSKSNRVESKKVPHKVSMNDTSKVKHKKRSKSPDPSTKKKKKISSSKNSKESSPISTTSSSSSKLYCKPVPNSSLVAVSTTAAVSQPASITPKPSNSDQVDTNSTSSKPLSWMDNTEISGNMTSNTSSNQRKRNHTTTSCPICAREFNLYKSSMEEVNAHINTCFEKQQTQLQEYERGKKSSRNRNKNLNQEQVEEYPYIDLLCPGEEDEWQITTKTLDQFQAEQEERAESIEFLYDGAGKKAMDELMLLYS